jgi:hypothetical protein
MPVPAPSSNRAPLGLEAARLRKGDPVNSSEAMRLCRSANLWTAVWGKRRSLFSFMEDGLKHPNSIALDRLFARLRNGHTRTRLIFPMD